MASTPCWRNARPRRSTVRWLPNWWSGNPPAARYKHSATHRRQYFSLDTEMRVTHYSYVLIKPFYGFCTIHPVAFNREVIEAVSTGPGFRLGIDGVGPSPELRLNGKFRTRTTTTKSFDCSSGRTAGAWPRTPSPGWRNL